MQVHTPVTSFENLSGRSFSDLLGQLEAASFSSEKQLEEKRRKLKDTKVTDLSGTVESIHTELATLREQKNYLEKTCDKNGDELAHYKKKINDLVRSTESLRLSLKAIKSQVHTQAQVQDAELLQKALQIDQLSGMLSEEKLKLSDLLKKLTSKSEWEAQAAAEHAKLGSIFEKKLGDVQSALQMVTSESHELITGLEACICSKNEYVVDTLKEIFANGVSAEGTKLMNALESGRETGVSRVVSELHEVANKIEHQLCESEGRIVTSNQQSASDILRVLEEQGKEKAAYGLQVNQLRARIVELEECIREKSAEISMEKEKRDDVAGKLQEEIHQLQLALLKHETSTEMLERELKDKSAALEKQNAVLESMKSTSLEKERISLQEVSQAHAILEEREQSYTALRGKSMLLEKDVSNLQSACDEMKQSIESKTKRIEELEREKRECGADLEELIRRELSLAMQLEKREQNVVKLETKLRDAENVHSREIDQLQKVLQLEREKVGKLEKQIES
ncbi:hypothetical protein Cantr_05713 [Candida viswanathii]|uniref:Uncharacterized protein n=1 Tax=Candida viswanathii TaxID=5486 RepID=A0A367XRM9_9ASCO|nr:hypothetical protein Cantr_05713 [Candida viswanathii]